MLGFNPLYRAVLGLLGGPIPTLNLNFLTGVLPAGVSFTRASNATMFDSQGRLVWAPANLLRSTQNLTLSPWTALGTTPPIVTHGEIAPDGTNTATFVDVSLADDCRLAQAVVASASIPDNAPFTFSAWIKRAPGETSNFLTSAYRSKDGSVTFISLPISDTWQRVSFTVPSALAGTFPTIIWISRRDGDTVTKYLVWNPMLTLGADLLPFVPNTSTTDEYFGPRFNYDPATFSLLGLLVEELRTNQIVNSAGVGGVGGSPGTSPTTWNISSVVGVTIATSFGVEDGLPYMDITYSGTNTSGATVFPTIRFGSVGAIPASNGQSWTGSAFVRKLSGSDPFGAWAVSIKSRDSGNALVSGQSISVACVDAAKLSVARQVASFTFSSASVASVECTVQTSVTNGASMDITVRIALPQLELGVFATSPIPTYGTAATRADETPWTSASFINVNQGTLFAWADVLPKTSVPGATQGIAIASDGTLNNRFGLAQAGGNAFPFYSVAGVSYTTPGDGAVGPAAVTRKYVTTYEAAERKLCVNSRPIQRLVSAAPPLAGITRLDLGVYPNGNGNRLNGHLKQVSYYPVVFTDAQMQAITI